MLLLDLTGDIDDRIVYLIVDEFTAFLPYKIILCMGWFILSASLFIMILYRKNSYCGESYGTIAYTFWRA